MNFFFFFCQQAFFVMTQYVLIGSVGSVKIKTNGRQIIISAENFEKIFRILGIFENYGKI